MLAVAERPSDWGAHFLAFWCHRAYSIGLSYSALIFYQPWRRGCGIDIHNSRSRKNISSILEIFFIWQALTFI